MKTICTDALDSEVYHNTKKLLKNYPIMKYLYITRKGRLAYERQIEAEKANCSIDELRKRAAELSTETFQGESSLVEKIKWLDLTIKYINANLDCLRTYPKKGELYYNLIQMRFIESMDRKEITYALNLSIPTYQRKMQEALKELDELLWSGMDSSIEDKMLAVVYNH